MDCEYVRTKEFVNGFLRRFFSEVESTKATPLQKKYDEYVGVDDVDFSTDGFGIRTLQYKRLVEQAEIPDDMRRLMNYNGLKMQCDQRHREMKRIALNLNSEHPETRKNATEHLER